MKKNLSFILILLIAASGIFLSFGSQEDTGSYSIGVFIPGQVQGSPTYELLVKGVQEAAADAGSRDVSIKVLEAGFNQADWGDKLRNLAATGSYDLIVSSNPSIPDLIAGIQNEFPDQHYLVMDAENTGIANLAAVHLNQYEQAYLSGYFAGLVTTSTELSGANNLKVAGLLAGQEYPVMDDEIRPGFEDGLKASAGEPASVEFRVLGNWYDAEKARELSDSMIRQGADVILTIAGSGNQGVISSAEAAGTYVLWYDSPGYEYAPGTVLGSSKLNMDALTRRLVDSAINGKLKFGSTEYVGIVDGAVDYARNDPNYEKYVPADIRAAMDKLINSVLNGDTVLKPAK